MAIVGVVVGLVAGGLLVTYASWRWVLFVNVPIGLVVAALATRVLPKTQQSAGRFDLPGAITATTGVAALVYGLSNAATTPDGVSHWGDAKVVASLAAAAVLLTAFVVVELRSKHPLLPFRLLRSRDRSGAYLISLSIGAGLIGMLFFLTLFVQEVWGYSALKTAVAFLPYVPPIIATTALAQRAVSRIGPRPLLITGGTIATGGMFWLSRITEHSSYAGGMLGPLLLLGTGLGLVFTPMSLVILNKVKPDDTGAASSGVNVGQQVGSSIGLAVLGTVAWSAVASSARSQATAAAKAGVHVSSAEAAALRTQIYHHALATGFARSYLVSAGILALIAVIALFMMRVTPADLSGSDPAPDGDGSSASTARADHEPDSAPATRAPSRLIT
jgi:predicted MFS family arabinose efflux permease